MDEQPPDALATRQRAFTHLLAHLSGGGTQQQEQECFEHFDALAQWISAQLDWKRLERLIDSIQTIQLQLPRSAHLRTYYAGHLAIRTQAYEHGEPLLTRVLSEADLAPDLRLRALRELALSYWFRTRYDQAITLQQQLAAEAQAIGDEAMVGLACLDLAMCNHEIEQYEAALSSCLRALAIFERRDEPHRLGNALYHAGLYSMYLGHWDAAHSYCARAGQLYESHGLRNALGYISWLQGYLAHIRGDLGTSEAAYRRALAIAGATEDGQPTQVLDAHLHLGFLYQAQGRYAEALERYDQALQLAAQIDRRHRICEITFRRGQVLERQGHLQSALAAYSASVDGIEALKGEFAREDIKIGLLGTSQPIYEAAVRLCVQLGQIDAAFMFVERARSRAFLDTLMQRSPELAAPFDQPVTPLADVQRWVPARTVLLEYFTVGVLPQGDMLINKIPPENTQLREQLTQPPEIFLFAIHRRGCELHRIKLDPNRLRPRPQDPYPGRHLLQGRLPEALYGHLIAPVDHLLEGCRVLYLIPHGPIHYVPFSALRKAPDHYLLRQRGPAIAQAPSATILLRACVSQPRGTSAGALAIGYDASDGPRPLRYAEAEAQHVAGLCHGQFWTGSDRKSERLIAEAGMVGQLHIAGHAHYDPEDPLSSALVLGHGDQLDARTIMQRLTLHANVVTLSSCTSGVSQVVRGDELMGLQRALLYAGASTIVCTRWEAYDMIALLIMDRFYRELHRSRPAIALRKAQVALRDMTLRQLQRAIRRLCARSEHLALLMRDLDRVALDARAQVSRWEGQAEDRSEWAPRAIAELPLSHSRPQDRAPEAPVDDRPFADAVFWAPFMVVGKA